MNYLKELIYRIRGEYTTEKLIKMGMRVGENFTRVTMAPRVHVLCHDASTKQFIGYTKIGGVKVGNNVFVGADTVILPSVTIGNNVIIGAHSTVTHDITDNSVVVGSPAKIICSLDEYLGKEKKRMKNSKCYGEEYTLRKNVSMEMRMKQNEELKGKIGYID